VSVLHPQLEPGRRTVRGAVGRGRSGLATSRSCTRAGVAVRVYARVDRATRSPAPCDVPIAPRVERTANKRPPLVATAWERSARVASRFGEQKSIAQHYGVAREQSGPRSR
jgi:hypothetical protein